MAGTHGCTYTVKATGGVCGEPAITEFTVRGETYYECIKHTPAFALRKAEKATKTAATRYCRKAACVEEAMGYEFVGHLAGTCGR